MANIEIRRYSSRDKKRIIDICYKTGYMGEDLTPLNLFNDRNLFAQLFCLYYLRYEADNCFVAALNDEAVGYIIGATNTKRQRICFALLAAAPILLRSLFYTSWKYPESFKAFMHFVSNGDLSSEPEKLNANYPAHLHINILPEYQHLGIGSSLLKAFEKEMAKKNIRGIHLKTSNKNGKAIPFYIKNGYSIIYEKEERVWKGVNDYKGLIFGKKL
ncbi:GNAT family N-acetyltransferase [Lutispora sp.]|uniref:GNAT family N-acetyltransferase n=1 Tax=Lutispora sp. TaxID=2828727 RepID=UPI002B220045|nr:GNAT family N-acetyltransferase [Lutispora sp.]MEA4962352.1 GNAT family N-acetyltransferase [Lutispora sp.]